MKCPRCESEFGFLDGFLTSGGLICRTCREIDTLSGKLKDFLGDEELGGLFTRLGNAGKSEAQILRLAEIDRARPSLRTAICAREIAAGREPAALPFAPPAAVQCDALAFLFAEAPRPALLDRMVALGEGDRAVQLLASAKQDIGKGWMPVIRKLAASGFSDRTFAIVLDYRANQSREVWTFLADNVSVARIEDLARWVSRARFVSIEERADFIRACRESAKKSNLTGGSLSPLEEAAAGTIAGDGDRLTFFERLGDRDRIDRLLSGMTKPDGASLAFLEKMAKSGARDRVLAVLERLDARGDEADTICRLAVSLYPGGDSPEVQALLERHQMWLEARDYLRKSASAPELEPAFRRRSAAGLNTAEIDGFHEIRAAIEAAFSGDASVAHRLLGSLIAAASRAPIAARSALAVDALIAGAEFEAIHELSTRMINLAKRRSVGRKPLKDEGAISKSEAAAQERFTRRVKQLLDEDGSPHFVLLWVDTIDRESVRKAEEDDDDIESRFESAVRASDAAAPTERELARPTFIARLAVYIFASVGGDRDRKGELRPLGRADLYGHLADRLSRSDDPSDKNSPWIGDRNDVIACALRALAFRPRVPATSRNRWGDFVFKNEGILAHLGYNPNYVNKFDEYRPSWMMTLDRMAPGEPVLMETDIIPPIDPIEKLSTLRLYSGPPAEKERRR